MYLKSFPAVLLSPVVHLITCLYSVRECCTCSSLHSYNIQFFSPRRFTCRTELTNNSPVTSQHSNVSTWLPSPFGNRLPALHTKSSSVSQSQSKNREQMKFQTEVLFCYIVTGRLPPVARPVTCPLKGFFVLR